MNDDYRQALVRALLKRRRGRPYADWKRLLLSPVLKVMQDHPELSSSEFADSVQTIVVEKTGRHLAIRTVVNWVRKIRP